MPDWETGIGALVIFRRDLEFCTEGDRFRRHGAQAGRCRQRRRRHAHPSGRSRKLIPTSHFSFSSIQSTKSVSYTTPDEVAWISSLEVPLFIGRVYLREGRSSCSPRNGCIRPCSNSHTSISNCCSIAGRAARPACARRLNVGPPVHSWSLAEAADLQLLVGYGHPPAAYRSVTGKQAFCEAFSRTRYCSGKLVNRRPTAQK